MHQHLHLISSNQCEILSDSKSINSNDVIYTYIDSKIWEQSAVNWLQSTNYPKNMLLQTYLDIILSGCLEYNDDFAIEFIQTTYQWRNIFLDRNNPIRKDWKCNKLQCDKIDGLLAYHLKQSHSLNLAKIRSFKKPISKL